LFGRPLQAVWPDQKLHEVFKLFRKSHTHMAIVRDVNSDGQHDPFYETRGIITMEDIFEEIIGDEILDETEADAGGGIYSKLKTFNPNIDFAQLKHLQNSSMLDPNADQRLSEEEVKSIVSFLNSQVPQIATLFGENNLTAIESLVKSSQVICIKNQSLLAMAQQQPQEQTDEEVASPDLLTLLEDREEGQQLQQQEDSKISGKVADESAPREYLYKRDKVANTCTLILRGTLKVIAGKEEFEIEKGAWSILGADILLEEDGAHVSDFSAYVTSADFRCLRILKPGIAANSAAASAIGNNGKRRTHITMMSQLAEEVPSSEMKRKSAPTESSSTREKGDQLTLTNTYNPMLAAGLQPHQPSSIKQQLSPDPMQRKKHQYQVKSVVDEYRSPGLQPHIGINLHPNRSVSTTQRAVVTSPLAEDSSAALLIPKPHSRTGNYESVKNDTRNPLHRSPDNIT
jgi:hypothetical protein